MALFSPSVTRYPEVGFVAVGGRGIVSSSVLTSSIRTLSLSRSNFFGCSQVLQCPVQRGWNPRRSLGARAAVKRRKEPSFDNVIQREKKLRIVSKIKAILVKQPMRTMPLLQLGRFRRDIGLTGKRRVVSLLTKFPAVFEVYEMGCGTMFVRLTMEADHMYEEEMKLLSELEVFHVEKLRKLVMMSVDKRINLDKIAHIKPDLGLPDDFRTNLCTRYPQYFKVVENETGPALELTSWDPLLAVSYAEKKAAAENSRGEDRPKIIIDGEEIVSTALSNRKLNLPKGLSLSKRDRVVALKFMELPFVSPYSDATGLDPASREAEKRAAATVQELLSLTLEKRTLIDHLTHFKKDYKFSQRIRAMLIRHPELFYVSFKGHRDSVFLREAWERSELLEADPQVLAKERLRQLVDIKVNNRRRSEKSAEDRSDGEDGYYDDDEESDEEIDESDDEYDDEDDEGWSEDDEDGGEHIQAKNVAKAPLPARSYAPSPWKPVKSYRELKPRPNDPRFEKTFEETFVPAGDDTPRERW